MKKALILIVMLAATAAIFAQVYAVDLFFSEYVEGTSNNKALEIFNGTGDPVDLSNYTIKLASNGGTWSTTNTLTMSGVLDDGEVYVIANSGAEASILSIANVTSTVTYYNGNDVVGLFNGTTLIDIIGVYQQDPGTTNWPVAGTASATAEHTLIRKPTVIQGNTDFVAGAGTNADDSEWTVHPQNYFADLGQHTFDPGAPQQAATPTFNPPAGVYGNPISVTISSTTPGATIRYTTDGSEPGETSTLYSAPVAVATTTTLKAKAFASGFSPSYTATASYIFPVQLANIAALRAAAADGTTIYQLANEVILTMQQAWRHQKFVQDATAAILIDDYNSIITTPYNIGDGITGITGTLNRYTTGMLQFWPVTNPGPATSTGNVIIPQLATIAEITNNAETYQSRLMRLDNVHYASPSGDYAAQTSYDLVDATGTIVMRTQFSDANYIGTPMHQGNFNVYVIVTQYNTATQVTPRMLSDFNPVANDDEVHTPFAIQLI
ncbi:MAG TPA: chitobiase/beta-hexosaminidase C-terminal domain-containing protein, partial [Candidatus Cloacimonas sp.]|nr:chitobiase/beta-hexosaminidase C-terminal domain-containing protein [Candidatus Cloacimonas sp.]